MQQRIEKQIQNSEKHLADLTRRSEDDRDAMHVQAISFFERKLERDRQTLKDIPSAVSAGEQPIAGAPADRGAPAPIIEVPPDTPPSACKAAEMPQAGPPTVLGPAASAAPDTPKLPITLKKITKEWVDTKPAITKDISDFRLNSICLPK